MDKKQTQTFGTDENRRKLLLGGAALSLMAVAPVSFSADHQHDHHKMSDKNKHSALIDAALDCIKKGEACKSHCIELIKAGNTDIADCLAAVEETLPMCEALMVLATSNSQHLGKLAKGCIDVCKSCEAACRKHEMHAACKACMESCAACIDECEKVAA